MNGGILCTFFLCCFSHIELFMRLIQDFFFDLYFQFGFPVWRWLLIYSNLGSPGFLCIHRLVSFISSSSFLATLSSNIPSLHSLFWHFKKLYVRHSYPIVQDSWTLSLYFQSIFLSMVQNLFDLLPVCSLFFIYVYNAIKPIHGTFNYNY